MTETKAGKDRSSMVKPIMKDVFFLGQKSEPATKEDLQSGRDLQDTLRAHKDRCVGMAANMIGVRKTTRYQNMEIEYLDFNWKKQRLKLTGAAAQICQHEMDHLQGKII